MAELLRKWWVALALVLAVGAGVFYVGHLRSALAGARRGQEASELRARGALVQVEASGRELAAAVGQVANLEEQLRLVKERAPGAELRVVERLVTKEVPAPSCLAQAGERLHFEVGRLELQAPSGSTVVSGVVGLYSGGKPLLSAPFEASLSSSMSAAAHGAQDATGWGAGLVLSLTREGWAAGPAVLLPPLRFWGFRLEASGGVAVSPSGPWVASFLAGVRL